ncbi:hypothetical protein H0H93_006471 [Arthromyces matolae]|nr:hypothetical protein H0H93_006471 [Arthromyces matolae]
MTRTKKAARKFRRKEVDDEYRSEAINMDNERFKAYYKAQNIVPEEEWDTFYDSLKQHLPTTFRVTGSRQDVHVPALSDVIFEDQKIPPPVQIQWYPDGLAWHFNVPKKVLRKSPEFKKFHSFLVFETEVGNVSRQEAVSMLPPLFLEVEPHHMVMDMCAAPGSKTAQLLEALHAQDSVTATSIPSGLLIANDSDQKRTHLLIHQSARLPSPAMMVTNLDASIYPSMKVAGPPGPSGEKRTRQLLFDRILCDVPCSGDGTIRKNMEIWKRWQPMDGNGLHSLQVRILQRAMKLLKPNGRIVYSTCSLNPVENEAVLATALKNNPDFSLVDVSDKLPELKRRPGLKSWRPSVDRSMDTGYATYEEFMAAQDAKGNPKTKLTDGHWPPADVDHYNLHRSMRIYPHLQDTGGFFVAVLEKRPSSDEPISRKRELSVPSEEPPEAKKPKLKDHEDLPEIVPSTVEDSDYVTNGVDAAIEDSSVPVASAVETPETVTEGSVKEKPKGEKGGGDFPSSNVLVRNPTGEAVRSLYIANDVVRSVVENNDYTRIRLSAAGTKVFSKQEGGKASAGTEPQFRVLSEGLPVILPFVDPATIIKADLSALKVLLQSYYPLVDSFSEPFKTTVETRPIGSHIVAFPPQESDGISLAHEIILPIWKSNVSLTLMMDKKAKSALSLRLFGNDITPNRTANGKQPDEKQVIQEADLLNTAND